MTPSEESLNVNVETVGRRRFISGVGQRVLLGGWTASLIACTSKTLTEGTATSSAAPASAPSESAGTGSAGSAATARSNVVNVASWPKGKTVVLLTVDGTSESHVRAIREAKRIGAQAGWKMEVFDSQGDYGKLSNGMLNYVNQGVDGFASVVVAPSLIGEGVAAANKAKIPIGGIFAGYEPTISFDVAANEWVSTARIGTYVLERLGGVGPSAKGGVVLLNWPNVPALVIRGIVAKSMLSYAKGVTLLKEEVLKVPGQVADAKSKTAALLQQYPKGQLSAIWAGWGEVGVAVSQAIREAGRQDDVFTVAIDGSQLEFNEIRSSGPLKATCANDMEGIAATCLDGLARIFQGQKPVATTIWVDAPLITKTNVPPSGQYAKGTGITTYYTGNN